MDRISSFKAFIEGSPTDPFPRYGLAMEYVKCGERDHANAAFDELMERFPSYIAAYLMAGNNLAALGRRPDALAVYRRGIEASTAAGDSHAKGELEAAIDELQSAE